MTGKQPPKGPRSRECPEDLPFEIVIEVDCGELEVVQGETAAATRKTMPDSLENLPVIKGTELPDLSQHEQQQPEIGSTQIASLLFGVFNDNYGGSWESFSRQLNEAANEFPTFKTLEEAFAVTSVSLPAVPSESEKEGINIVIQPEGIEGFKSIPIENANISTHFILPSDPAPLQSRVTELTQPQPSGLRINFYEPASTDPRLKALHYEFCIVAMIFTAYTETIVRDNIEGVIPFAAAVDVYNSIQRSSFDHKLFAEVWNQVVANYGANLEN